MDAGARGRRLLQRREYKAKVSEFIPKELEDHVVYENPNTNLFPDGTQEKVKRFLDKGTEIMNKNKILRTIGNVFKSKNPGSNYTKDGKVTAESNSAQQKAMNDAKMKKMEDDKVASKKKNVKEESELERIQNAIKTKTMNGKPLNDKQIEGLKAGLTQGGNKVQEGTKYGMYKGSGKASGAMKDYLDKKKKEKKKVDEACWKGYEKKGMKTMFGKRYPNCVKKTKSEEVEQIDEYSPNMSYQAKGGKKSGKLGKSSVYSLRRDDESKKEFRKSHTKDIKDGLLKKEEVEVAEDMKGMSQKSGDKRSTESGAGMTAKGVAKYNRRTGGNLKTAVTTPPSKLKAGSKAAGRRKSFCARSKSWTGPRGKAARRRWNCSYEPELPMIPESKKKLYNTSPLSARVSNWAKGIKEGDSYVKSDRNKFGLPKDLKSVEKKVDKKVTGVNYGAMAQSYVPQGEVIQEMPDDIKGAIMNNLRGGAGEFSKGGDFKDIIKSRLKKTAKDVINTDTVKKNLNMGEAKMTSSEKDKKEKYVKGMKKDKSGFVKRYGKDAKSVMYATATKMSMKEGSCGKGEYYCNDDQKCKPIPDGYKEGKDGMLVKEAKYEKGASDYGKTSIRNKRAFGKGGNAAPPKERGGAKMLRHDSHTKRRGVKKNNKYGATNKPPVYGAPSDEFKKNKNVKENFVKDLLNNARKTVNKYNNKLQKNNDAINKVMPGTAGFEKKPIKLEGSLHKWFKGSKSKDGKGGWVNVVTGGTCASDKPGEGTPKCVSSSKRASMSKSERLSASRRKKKADPGQQSKSGAAKPTYVATDKKKK